MYKMFLIPSLVVCLASCASITNDANVPIALSFSDGSEGTCNLSNKRNAMSVNIPSTPMVRRSDDVLKYECTTKKGKKGFGGIASTMGGKIVASAVFLDF